MGFFKNTGSGLYAIKNELYSKINKCLFISSNIMVVDNSPNTIELFIITDELNINVFGNVIIKDYSLFSSILEKHNITIAGDIIDCNYNNYKYLNLPNLRYNNITQSNYLTKQDTNKFHFSEIVYEVIDKYTWEIKVPPLPSLLNIYITLENTYE